MRLNYRAIKDLVVLSSEDLEIIEQRAKALTIDECLDYLCLTWDELTQAEITYVKKAHRKGVTDGVYTAVKYLFQSMQGRNGGQAALDYLRTRSESFKVDATPTAKSGFSFVVDMGDK